jgi:hypothetical protein
VVNGDYSFVGGYKANIQHNSVFMRSDNYGFNNPVTLSSTQPYTFIIRAKNGVGIGTADPLGMNLRVWD